jgi:hypothetical protein
MGMWLFDKTFWEAVVQDQSRQPMSWEWWHISTIPVVWEALVGGSRPRLAPSKNVKPYSKK